MALTDIVASRIREVRLLRGMTQAEVAQVSGIAVHEISKMENGKRAPRLESLEKIALALRVAPSELLQAHATDAGLDEVMEISQLLHGQNERTCRQALAVLQALVRTA